MGTELAIEHYKINKSTANRLLANSEACGRGLQKTNIIKDFAKDQNRGVCYLPKEWLQEVNFTPLFLKGAPLHWKRKVLSDILDELKDSVEYVVDLPYSATSYRLASLLCLFPAYETILLAAKINDQFFTNEHHIKISRETMYQCVLNARELLNDNVGIMNYSSELNGAINTLLIS